AGRGVGLYEIGAGLGGDQRVALLAGQGGGPLASSGDRDRRWAVGPVEQPGMVEPEMLALIMRELSGEEPLDDVDRLRQALVPLADAGPAPADDVLVEPLARA